MRALAFLERKASHLTLDQMVTCPAVPVPTPERAQLSCQLPLAGRRAGRYARTPRSHLDSPRRSQPHLVTGTSVPSIPPSDRRLTHRKGKRHHRSVFWSPHLISRAFFFPFKEYKQTDKQTNKGPEKKKQKDHFLQIIKSQNRFYILDEL